MATIRKGCGCVRPYSPGSRVVQSRSSRTTSLKASAGGIKTRPCQSCKKKRSKNGG